MLRLMNRILVLGAACASLAAFAKPLELNLTQNGEILVGGTPASLRLEIHEEGWNGAPKTSAWRDFEAPGDKPDCVHFRFVHQGSFVLFTKAVGESTTLLATGQSKLTPADDGRATFEATVTSAKDQRPEAVALTMNLPAGAFAGTKWTRSDGASGVIAKDWDGKSVRLWEKPVDWIELTPPGANSIRIEFPAPTLVLLQDNRAWNPSFSLRIMPETGRVFNRGDVRAFKCTFATDAKEGVKAATPAPIVIEAGDEWTPIDYRKEIVAGSALDFSNQGMRDAPAGKYGWMKVVDGHFEFEKLPGKAQRFYGGNLCQTACFPDHALADTLVTRLVRLGYNAVRIHHYETKEGITKGAPDGLQLNPEMTDRLDYLIAKCIENGLYVTTDLFVTRHVTWRAIGIDRDGYVPHQIYKNLVTTHEPAYRNWEAFTRIFLNHVNPYTGRAYKDEPGLPTLSLVNEGVLSWASCWNEIKHEEPMKKAWADWLAEKRKGDPSFGAGSDDINTVNFSRAIDNAFMADLERRFVVRARRLLRDELGVKALLTNQNCGAPDSAKMMKVRDDLYDYVDDHFYVDHPQFVAGEWELPSYCDNGNPLRAQWLPPVNCAFARIPSKPFTISEWNFAGPGMFRSVGGILTGALAALQDWDGLWRFAYSESLKTVRDRSGVPGYFDVASDPLAQAGERASIFLFLRRDLEPIEDRLVTVVSPEAADAKDGAELRLSPRWNAAAWQVRTGVSFAPVPGVPCVDLKATRDLEKAPVELKPNAAIVADRESGVFRIVTPRTSGGFTPFGQLEAGAVAFDAGVEPTTLWASSLDGRPIPESERILVSHLTDVQADGNVYADKSRRMLLKWGKFPPLARNGTAQVSLALSHPGDYSVWALATDGTRVEKIPCEAKGGLLRFTASVKGPHGARMLYEVVK